MRAPVLLLSAAAVLVVAAAPVALAKGAGDASVGVCTRKDEFAKRQAALDEKVAALGAADAKKRGKLERALAKAGESDIEALIRYREPHLVPVHAAIVKQSKKWFTRTRALYALKMIGDPVAVPVAVEALSDGDSMVRDAAAVTLGHLGGEEAVAALEAALAKERDPFVKASVEASLRVADGSARTWQGRADKKRWEETLDGPRGARRVAYAWTWKGTSLFNDYHAQSVEYPEATTFSYPIQRYEEDLFAGYPRNSFAAGGNHAAEDCAWFRDGCSYFAIADGVVRMVQGAGGDWGFLVVLEHRLPGGRFVTSVYGHCAFDVTVRPGDVVRAGQRIATQGLSCSMENGGYGAHIHFGLGDGPFRRPPGLAVGDQVDVEIEGSKEDVEILRFGYSAQGRNSLGWPLTTLVVRRKGGAEATVEMKEQPVQDELRWFQAYVPKCRGWLDPQKQLPEWVEKSTK